MPAKIQDPTRNVAPNRGLLSLPNELLCMIAEETRPDGFHAFQATCTQIHIAVSVIVPSHREMITRYRTMNCVELTQNIVQSAAPLGLRTAGVLDNLVHVLNNPFAAKYVQTAYITNWILRRSEHDIDACLQWILRDSEQKLRNHLANLPVYHKLDNDDANDVINTIWTPKRGVDRIYDTEWLMLLVQLPNLRKLIFDNMWGMFIVSAIFSRASPFTDCLYQHHVTVALVRWLTPVPVSTRKSSSWQRA